MADLFTGLTSQLNRLVIQLLVVCLITEVDGSFLCVSYINNINVLTQVADVIRRVKRVVCHRLTIDRWRKAGYLWNCDIAGLGWVRLIIWILSRRLIFIAVRTDDQIAQLFIGILNVDRLWDVDTVNSYITVVCLNLFWLTISKIKFINRFPTTKPSLLKYFDMHQTSCSINLGKLSLGSIMPVFGVGYVLFTKWWHEAIGVWWFFGKIAIDYLTALCCIDLTIQPFLNDWVADRVALAINISRCLCFDLRNHETNAAIVSIILTCLRVKDVELWLPGTIRSNKDTWLTIIVNCAKISLVISSYFCWFIFINRVLT